MSSAPTKYCHACGTPIDYRAEICPHCGVRQPMSYRPDWQDDPEIRAASGTKIAAGICGIMLGAFGVHKFILGFNMAGVIMLVATIGTCFIGYIPMSILGAIEGIVYLTKSDEDFYRTYIVERREWI